MHFRANLTGLFRRGGSYYIRIVLPESHPLREQNRCGRLIQTLGACGHREAVIKGTVYRAQVLAGFLTSPKQAVLHENVTPPASDAKLIRLRDIYDRWVKSKPLTADSIASCGRVLKSVRRTDKQHPPARADAGAWRRL